MTDINNKIRKACFDLSVALMWEKENLTLDKIEEQIQELNQMTEKLYNISKFHLNTIESLKNQDEIIIRTINYINQVHAMPYFRGNYEWFEFTLHAITEMVRPNSRITSANLPFLKDLEFGIKDYKANILDEG